MTGFRVALAAIAALLLTMVWFGHGSALAQEASANPFPRPGEEAPPETAPAPGGRGYWGEAVDGIRQIQEDLQRSLGRAARALKTEGSLGALMTVLGISFAYGVFHAAGPGHGKVVVSTYLLANERQLKRGLLLAGLGALFQALSAIAFVLVLAVILGMARGDALRSVYLLEAASYAAIILVGLWIITSALGLKLQRLRLPVGGKAPALKAAPPERAMPAHEHTGAAHIHDEHCGHKHGPTLAEIDEKRSLGELIGVAASIGIRPCSGAVLMLLLTLAQGIFIVGIISAFVMSVGTALTVAAIAVLTLLAKGTALRVFGRDRPEARRLGQVIRVAAGLAIIIFGALLLEATLTAPRPIL